MTLTIRPPGADAPPATITSEIVGDARPTGIVVLTGTTFGRGRRRIGWRGYASVLDKQDPSTHEPRTVRQSITRGLLPRRVVDGLRNTANSLTRYCATPGVTTRAIFTLNETHNELSRPYVWSGREGYVIDMDAVDADRLLRHPHVGPEFYDADLAGTDPRHDPNPVQPSNATLTYWATEAKRLPDPHRMLKALPQAVARGRR